VTDACIPIRYYLLQGGGIVSSVSVQLTWEEVQDGIYNKVVS